MIPIRQTLGAALLLAAGLGTAWADSGPRVPLLPQYTQECGGCHAPYPPGLLPAASWQRLMSGLRQHFGTDASLDGPAAKDLTGWLTSNAGTGRRSASTPPQDRITLSPWFIREHREVAAATWKLPAVNSAANCAACHTQADSGDYRERNTRIPR
jgi:Dihaem cytochrome c